MPAAFAPDDLLCYQSLSSLTATQKSAACVVQVPDQASGANDARIWLFLIDGGEPSVFTSGQDSAPKWSPDGTELAFVSSRGENGLQAYIISANGGEARCVTSLKGAVSAVEWSPDGSRLLLTAKQDVDPSLRGERGPAPAAKVPEVVWRLPYKSDGMGYTLDREIHLFVVDKDGGEAVQLTDGPFDVRSAEFSPDERRIAFVRTRVGREAHRTDVWMMNADGSDPVQLSHDVATCQYPRWSPDGHWIVFSGSEQEGDSRVRLWLIDTRSQSVRALGDERLQVESGSSVYWSDDSAKVYFILARCGLQEVATIAIADGDMKVLVSGHRLVLELAVTSDQLFYAAASIDTPNQLFACDLEGQNERCLTSFNTWWVDKSPPQVWLKSFEVPDGEGGTETIDGWLMLPADAGKGPFPLLLDVHGGPQSYAFLEFPKTMWRHVLCSKGWAVLALNPVGSSSYGYEFMTRLRNRWGELDLPQQLAAVQTLQDEGVADDRVAIYGKSYGGYLSAWAITQTDIFRAAVIAAPVSNIESHFGTSDSGYYVTPYAIMGEPYVDRTKSRELCPMDHMHRARTPTLLLQGKDDQRCPIGQSEEIFATLMRSSDVAVEMVLYPGGDHHLVERGSPDFRIDFVTRLVDWVEKWAERHPDDDGQTDPEDATESSASVEHAH